MLNTTWRKKADQEGGLIFNSRCKPGQSKYVLKPITGPFADHMNNSCFASSVALSVQCHYYALRYIKKYINPEPINCDSQLSALVVICP